MKFTFLLRSAFALATLALAVGAGANSFGFDQSTVSTQDDGFSVSVEYDFGDFAMFGGAVDIIYDPTEITFAGFAAGFLPLDAELLSPIGGVLTEPGLIGNFGVLATNFFQGVNSSATLGTFMFTFTGTGSGNTPCGATLCIVTDPLNPFISIEGFDVTADILPQSITSVQATQVPVPAAIWLVLSALGLLVGKGSRSG